MGTVILKSKKKSQVKQIRQDTLFDGLLTCRQHDTGYRFSVDSVLLAHFPKIGRKETILDLGTGCGVVGLILCYRHKASLLSITGIEYQPDLAELARINICENGFTDTFRLVNDDLVNYKDLFEPESFSLVVSNPPFYAKGTGRTNKDTEAMAARHQSDTGLRGFVQAAAFCVKNRGRAVFIYPAELSSDLFDCLQQYRLTPKIIEYIYSYPESDHASLVVVESLKNGGVGCQVRAPFYLYRNKNGPYSKRSEMMFTP